MYSLIGHESFWGTVITTTHHGREEFLRSSKTATKGILENTKCKANTMDFSVQHATKMYIILA